MEKLQFRVLYRQFLFRMVDLELLSTSAQGDISRLLGQFAALLISVSLVLGLIIFFAGDGPPQTAGGGMARLLFAWATEHFLIALTILVVGLFSVFSWDSIFPDRRDVLVLAPLPIRARTLFGAKLAAVGAAFGISVVAINAGSGFAAPLVYGTAPVMTASLFAPLQTPGPFLGIVRLYGAYWLTMLAAGTFTLCLVVTIQGMAQLLPRQKFLRVSAFLQIAVFILFLTMFFTQLPFASPADLLSPAGQQWVRWLPSYWFFGLLQELNGSSMFSSGPEFVSVFARRAKIGLAASVCGAALSYLICYFRTMRMIAEQPDILPGRASLRWLPSFGGPLATAVAQFSIRTLARSQRHRVMVSFYLGIAFGIVLFLLKAPVIQNQTSGDRWHQPNPEVIVATILMSCSIVIGSRVAFAMPLDLRANWIFRVTPVRGAKDCLSAARRALIALAVVPVSLACGVALFWMWPWQQAAEHLILVVLIAMLAVEAAMLNFRKIPFTCSYLPGKTYFHMAVIAYVIAALLLGQGAKFEKDALMERSRAMATLLAASAAAVVVLRKRASMLAGSGAQKLEFEDTRAPVILGLGLSRDGTPV